MVGLETYATAHISNRPIVGTNDIDYLPCNVRGGGVFRAVRVV